MLLKDGTSDEVVSANVTQLVTEGVAPDVAVVKAYLHAGRSRCEAGLAAAAMSQSPEGHDIAQPDATGFRPAPARMVGYVGR